MYSLVSANNNKQLNFLSTEFIILTYLTLSRGSSEVDQLTGFDFTAPSAEQNSHLDPTPSTTADFSDTVIENFLPTSDTHVEVFPPNDPTDAPSSDNVVRDFFLTNDTAVETFLQSDPAVIATPSSDVIFRDFFPTNDTAVEILRQFDSNVTNSPSSDTVVGDSFRTNDTAVEIFPPSESNNKLSLPNYTVVVKDSFPTNTADEIIPSSDRTVNNGPSKDTLFENSFPNNYTNAENFPLNDLTIKNASFSDTTVEYPYPTSESTTDNSPAPDLPDLNVPSIDAIVDNSPPLSYTTGEDSPSTLYNIVQHTTSETPVFIDNNEWGNAAANLEPLIHNYPCKKQECPNNYKTTYKPINTEHTLTRKTRGHTLPFYGVQKPNCPVERTLHIGSFVVPSQQDIIRTMRKLLQDTFANYRMKTISFLENIEKASRMMIEEYEKNCSNKTEYHECVERVGSGTKMITSSLLNSMENTMKEIEFLHESLNCNLSDPAIIDDPIKLIKLIASETATIDFALPGFLRLLYTCFRFCNSHTEYVASIGTYSHPYNLKKVIHAPLHSASHLNSNLMDLDSGLLHFSSRSHHKTFGRMINLKKKPAAELKYFNLDRISYFKKQ